MTNPFRSALAALGSVRARLTLLNVAVLSLSLAVFGIGVRYTVAASLAARLDRNLQARTERLQDWWPMLRRPRMLAYVRSMRDRYGRPLFEQDALPGTMMPEGRDGGALIPPPELFRSGGDLPESLRRRAQSYLFPSGDSREATFARPETIYPPRLLGRDGRALLSGNRVPVWDPAAVKQILASERAAYSSVVRDGVPLQVYTAPLRSKGRTGTIEGVIQMASSRTAMLDEINHLTTTLLTLAPAALLLSGVGAAFLTHRALAPVRDITTAAAEIEASDLSARLPVRGEDEFARLSATFNGMLGRLGTAFDGLERAVEQQRRFTADASHELKTPLAIARMGVGLALSRERSPEEYRQALSTVGQSLERMTRLVADLLLLARSDEGQVEIGREPVPLAALLEAVASPQRQAPGAPAITVTVKQAPGTLPLAVRGNAHHLSRVFQNLLDNAVRHTPASGRITLAAQAGPGEDQVTVVITDTGEGIAPEHLPRLFDRFYRADSGRARSQGGTGLGLAICREIVTLHGGEIHIDSQLGQGTRVTVTLPRATV